MRESYYSSGFREVGSMVQPLKHDRLQLLFGTNELQSAATYEATLEQAWGVLRQQPGIVTLRPDIPVYILPDVQADRQFMRSFLGQRVSKSHSLLDALIADEAIAVLVGDIAHSHEGQQWQRDENHVIGVARDELAKTMNAQLYAFSLVSALPKNFFWVSGNHDRQRLIPFGTTNDKNLAIAAEMQKKLGSRLLIKWTETEDELPHAAIREDVIVTHAAPGSDVAIADIIGKKDTAFAKLTGTENRPGKPESMTEEEMRDNMQSILKQLELERGFEPVSELVWVIGHRQTDKEPEGFRRYCGDRIIQINDPKRQLYAVIKQRSLFVGSCRSDKKPKQIERNIG